MLILSWLFLGVLISVQRALCSDVQDDTSVYGKLSEQDHTEVESYRYHHPPQLEITREATAHKEQFVNINEQLPPPPHKARSRVVRRNKIRKTNNKSNIEIPVAVIYEPQSTTVSARKNRVRFTQTTSSPVKRTTRVQVKRNRPESSNVSKKIDIRQTTIENTNVDEDNISEETQTYHEISDISTSTAFPKRSRGSYFKKRTEPPTPRVKILEQKNFVFSHSGNFHYSFEGGDGTKVSSEGSLKSFENKKSGESVSGNVFYKDKDGNDFSLSYTADENGYRPVGAHLPTPPPLPPAIARALKYIADKSTTTPNCYRTDKCNNCFELFDLTRNRDRFQQRYLKKKMIS